MNIPHDISFMSLDEYCDMHDVALERFWEEGHTAAKNGITQCPYKGSAPDWVVETWWDGWDTAKKEEER